MRYEVFPGRTHYGLRFARLCAYTLHSEGYGKTVMGSKLQHHPYRQITHHTQVKRESAESAKSVLSCCVGRMSDTLQE